MLLFDSLDVIIAGLDPQADIKIDQKKELERDKERLNPPTYIRRKSHNEIAKDLLRKEK